MIPYPSNLLLYNELDEFTLPRRTSPENIGKPAAAVTRRRVTGTAMFIRGSHACALPVLGAPTRDQGKDIHPARGSHAPTRDLRELVK